MISGWSPSRLLRPSIGELWAFLAVALPVLAALLATLPTVDLAYQLRAGTEILGGRGIPSVDTWTFTAAGQPWLDQQWGAQAALAAVYGVAGWTGLAILRAGLVGLTCGLVMWAIRRRAPLMHPRSAALLTLAAFVVMSPALALRPQLFGMALFAAVLLILAGRKDRPRSLWALPLIAVIWANTHGSFILAPVLVGLAWVEDLLERDRDRDRDRGSVRLAVATALTGAATLITPFGVGAWQYALGLATNRQVTARISEWQPPTLGSAFGVLFWVSVLLVAVAAGLLIRRRVGIPWVAVLTLGLFAALGAIAERGIAWWPGVAAVTLAGMTVGRSARSWDASSPPNAPELRTPPVPAPRTRRGSPVNAVVAAVLIVAGITLLPVWRPTDHGLRAPSGLLGQAPSGVTGALRDLATAHDRVWNPQVWGSWLEFAVPSPQYAFDARIEVFPAAAWANLDLVERAGPGWSDVLDAAEVSIVVAEGSETTALAQALSSSPEWTSAYTDADGSIWVRAGR